MADLYVGNGDGWTHIGQSEDGEIKFQFEPQIPVAGLVPVRWPPDITLSITVDASQAIRALRRAWRALGRLIHRTEHSGSYSHCKTCHPEQGPPAARGRRTRTPPPAPSQAAKPASRAPVNPVAEPREDGSYGADR